MQSGETWALVTGAATGIGRCFAQQLATKGYNLVIVGLNAEGLARTRTELRKTYGIDVHAQCIDLAQPDASQKLFDFVQAQGVNIDVLINNAGTFSFLDILQTPAERIERTILLHNLTTTLTCRHFAESMVQRGIKGHILNMSSFSLWMPFPGLALYSASKAFVRSFSIAFAKEVREHGIRVTTVCPAGVATNLYGLPLRWQRIGLRLGVLISADNCARRSLRAMWHGRRCIVPDWWNRLWIPFCQLIPMCAVRPLRQMTSKYQK